MTKFFLRFVLFSFVLIWIIVIFLSFSDLLVRKNILGFLSFIGNIFVWNASNPWVLLVCISTIMAAVISTQKAIIKGKYSFRWAMAYSILVAFLLYLLPILFAIISLLISYLIGFGLRYQIRPDMMGSAIWFWIGLIICLIVSFIFFFLPSVIWAWIYKNKDISIGDWAVTEKAKKRKGEIG